MFFFSSKKIDLIERITLSFALSIAIVPLMVFYLNLLGIPINAVSVSMQIIILIAILLLFLSFRYLLKNNDKK